MFESAELGHAISQRAYARAAPKLREALLDAQYDLFQDGRFPVMILIAGVDGAGKGETINLLNEWMDPRHIKVAAFGEPSDEERERPPMWRYWRELPPKGTIGIFFGHWYTDPILDRVYGKSRQPELIQSIEAIVRFEKMLADEGALLLKFWFHLSKQKQKKRLKALERDPQTRWRVTKTDWRNFKLYDRIRKVAGLVLRQTGSGAAPWLVVEGEDARYRNLTVGRALLAATRERLDQKPEKPAADGIPPLPLPIDNRHILGALDLGLKLDRRKYTEQREVYQGRLNVLSRHPRFRERSAVLVLRATTPRAKAAPSAASQRRSMPATTAPSRLLRRPKRSRPSPISGGSGGTSRGSAGSRCSTVPGTDGCWLNGSRALPASSTGRAPIPRSMISKSSSPIMASSWSNSGWRSARTSSTAASGNARRPRSSALRSRRRTGATARNGKLMNRRCATWWTAPPLQSRHGRWWKPTTSATRASRY